MRKITDIVYDSYYPNVCKLDLYMPDGEFDAVYVDFHGGGLGWGQKEHDAGICYAMTEHGIAAVSADYRMYPSARYPDFIYDAAAAVAWVVKNIAKYSSDPVKVFVGGNSAGAYLSMMLCLDSKYYAAHELLENSIAGYIFNGGQPTAHFNVLRERGLDSRRVIIDETAPLYHIGLQKALPPIQIYVAEHDMENRIEQNQLLLSTLRHFKYDMSKIEYYVIPNATHCSYCGDKLQFTDRVAEFICKYSQE